ncbi:uncharacterized protein LOC122372903 isoform X1 [Amphibalanus amphitrite]|uniref:uncharacterized protein LOC122372903 isoform X1 n=1 Tax=Amphibalanus amphitrite TaxID=1232801 RepID=UPI001C91A364|nr:uncharacterized protein LOC122372903 isoform X1 [Amphibalanus amphitrite]
MEVVVRSCILIAIFGTVIGAVTGYSDVHISRVRMPAVVLNGSLPSVVLDCDYELETADRTAAGLVVKWYRDRSPAPVYQWIPGHRPQAFGALRGHVNLGHVVSDDPLKVHRAVQIVRPTTQMSGDYTCRVTTWRGVDSATKKMVIYAPAQWMNLTSTKPARHQVNITCLVNGVYPEPVVDIFVGSSQSNRRRMRGLRVEKSWKDGAYTVRVQKLEEDRHLPPEAVIECVLTLPDTDYRRSRRIMYFHGTAPQSLASVRGAPSAPEPGRYSLSGSSSAVSPLGFLTGLCLLWSLGISLRLPT